MGKKKKFIDKKNAVTFHLVHRSQQDPLQADESAPKHTETRKEEQRKYGVYFDDEYDYMQHLRDVGELQSVGPGETFKLNHTTAAPDNKLQLSSRLFGSEAATNVGLLNKAAPSSGPLLDWDPEIVATLDDEYDHGEDELDDDFVMRANDASDLTSLDEDLEERDKSEMMRNYLAGMPAQPDSDYYNQHVDLEREEDEDDEEDFSSDFSDNEDETENDMFEKEETKTRFTDYSMTSSVIRRNQGLSLLDDRFEALFAQYDDDEIGALDQDEITGNVGDSHALMQHVLEEFDAKNRKDLETVMEAPEAVHEDEEDEGVPEELEEEESDKDERWDCTYTTDSNLPTMIPAPKSRKKQIKLTKKAQIPDGIIPSRPLPPVEERLGVKDVMEVNTDRPVNETPDERKLRKKAVKEYRQARREEKKANKTQFKLEKSRQTKETLNLQRNLSGIKIS